MFTGIIESVGEITSTEQSGTNLTFWVKSNISAALKPDQSVSHNGVCLTVEEVNNDKHRVTAIAETLQKTNLGKLKTGQLVNLERCMTMNGRIDGHIVQGHVDTTAKCIEVIEKEVRENSLKSLNEYFDIYVKCLEDNNATVDKFIGDAVMAFWNAPSKVENHEFITQLEINKS